MATKFKIVLLLFALVFIFMWYEKPGAEVIKLDKIEITPKGFDEDFKSSVVPTEPKKKEEPKKPVKKEKPKKEERKVPTLKKKYQD